MIDPSEPPPPTLPLSAGLIFRSILVVIGLLLVAHVAGQFAEHQLEKPNLKGFVPRTNMNGELSLPTLFATLLLGVGALLFGMIGWIGRRAGDRFSNWWLALALLFTFLMADEAITIHEMTIAPLRDFLGVTEGWLFFAWVIPAALLTAVLLIVYVPFLRNLPDLTRRNLLIAAALMMSGALGVELISGWYLSSRGDDLLYEMIGAVEETLELLGAGFLVKGLLDHLGRTWGEVRFTIAA
ncbi:MAG: hypothetical protein IT334_03755 [Thermomicrobiales bacterium]|nr:hypothetical protein [Thermomicrobiales bacterium]